VTCQFLENLSFANLIAPVSEEEFRERHWEQQPLIVHRNAPDYYDGFFTLEDFDDAVMRSPDYVKISEAKVKMSTSYVTPTVSGLEAILAGLRDGGTLVMDHVELREKKLGLACRVLAQEVGHKFQANLYLTPPYGKGSIPHWDNHDVFILQVHGAKRWTIEKERRVLPRKGEKMGHAGRTFQGALSTITLDQGDLFYIPRGFVHAAECESNTSLHVTLGINPFFLEDLIYSALTAAIQSDDDLRRALPIRFMEGGREDLTKSIRDALLKCADEVVLDSVVELFRNELVKSFPLDISGQIVGVFGSESLHGGAIVGPRKGVVYRLHAGTDAVHIYVGTRSIVFPDIYREPLKFALGTPRFTVNELPGELNREEEKIAFIERLMQEGLIIRK
jgi:ribosomal protein L16 Arg81 hydroxylase